MDAVHGVQRGGPGGARLVDLASAYVHGTEVSEDHGVRAGKRHCLAGAHAATELLECTGAVLSYLPGCWKLAVEEIALARRWGAPTALGRALRIAGLLHGGPAGLALLREATTVLASSPARLEYAKALVDTSSALRHPDQQTESHHHLHRGVERAHICGATPLAQRGNALLRASGAQLPSVAASAPGNLRSPLTRNGTKCGVLHSP